MKKFAIGTKASRVAMIRIRAAILVSVALISLIVNSSIEWDLIENRSKAPSVPGDFVVKGACNFEAIKEQHETVDLGMFVKHGLHVTKFFFPEDCTLMDRHVIIAERSGIDKTDAWHPTRTVNEFIDSPIQHKILAVRDPASFYKSAFNHVCNKKTVAKKIWRRRNRINCHRKKEFKKLLSLNEQELSDKYSPVVSYLGGGYGCDRKSGSAMGHVFLAAKTHSRAFAITYYSRNR